MERLNIHLQNVHKARSKIHENKLKQNLIHSDDTFDEDNETGQTNDMDEESIGNKTKKKRKYKRKYLQPQPKRRKKRRRKNLEERVENVIDEGWNDIVKNISGEQVSKVEKNLFFKG